MGAELATSYFSGSPTIGFAEKKEAEKKTDDSDDEKEDYKTSPPVITISFEQTAGNILKNPRTACFCTQAFQSLPEIPPEKA